MMFFAFRGALGSVGIVVGDFIHDERSCFRGKLLTRPACGCDSQFAKALTGLQSLVGLGIALDDVAEFRDTFVLFAEFNQRKSFFQLSRSSFVSGGEVLQNLVVALRGLL